MTPPPIDTVFFDAGFTLVDIEPSLGAVYAGVAAAIGHPFDADRFQAVGVEMWRKRHAPRYRAALESSESIERASWRDFTRDVTDALEPEGFAPDFDTWFDALYERFADPAVWRPMEGAHETLRALEASGYRLGVVSNWDARLHPVLEGHGLDGYFSFVLTSAAAGWRKPSPTIFERALSDLGSRPETTMHVGDSFEDDVVGARRAGIRPVHLTSDPDRHDGSCDTISSLSEVLELLPR